jgi:hypothetical protein
MSTSGSVVSAEPSPADPTALMFGIEAEFALVDARGRLCDFRTLPYRTAQDIVDRLDRTTPATLVRGDLGIKTGRWYVEGDERFDHDGRFVDCVPKGLETRTPPIAGIGAAVEALRDQTVALAHAAAAGGYRLASIGWNPEARAYAPSPPYTAWERAMRARSPVWLAPDVYMLSYGPDLNLSHPAWTDADAVDVAEMLTALSPALVPFAFSAPFVGGRVAGTLSRRTQLRTGRRPAARAFVDPAHVPAAQAWPPLIHAARIPAERGRVEFKAFDAIVDPALYPALLGLLAGLVTARPRPARAAVPDARAHARVAVRGFDDPDVAETARALVDAARVPLRRAADRWDALLDPLADAVAARRTPAHALLAIHRRTGVIPLSTVEV